MSFMLSLAVHMEVFQKNLYVQGWKFLSRLVHEQADEKRLGVYSSKSSG